MNDVKVRAFFLSTAGLREETTAASTLDEHSLSLPRGAYTTFRTYHGTQAFRLEEHLNRLSESAMLDGFPLEFAHPAARHAIAEAVSLAGFSESRVRLTFPYEPSGGLYIALAPFAPLPARLYQEGAHCVTAAPGLKRANPRSKGTSFIQPGSQARAGLAAAHEILLLSEGAILEGSSSNFFAVLGGALYTAEEGVLFGTTRNLALAQAEGVLPVIRTPVSVADVPRLQEAFLTSVSRVVLPVTRIDGIAIGDGVPGPHTKAIGRGVLAAITAELAPISP
ncbi:MAG TPA: aminotransferase class IV [Chloroflexota bacterium]|nr:aminotransferase class IV [Chloroflexota bacterium]